MSRAKRPLDPKTEKLLKRVGYTALKAKGRKGNGIPFPDLKTDKPGVAPTSDRVAYAPTVTKPMAQIPEGFFIGHGHKQGLELMPIRELEWGGGKKS